MKPATTVILCSAFAVSTASAAAMQSAAAPGLPAELVQGQVHYVTGGIGLDQANAFRRAERHYPLTLEFAIRAKPRDEFTADVMVRISNAQGQTVLETVSGGPFLLAKLPAGTYDIQATRRGKTLQRRATVTTAASTHVGFVWETAGAAADARS
jgi:hypothetical protein